MVIIIRLPKTARDGKQKNWVRICLWSGLLSCYSFVAI